MAKVTVLFGFLLIVLGVVVYLVATSRNADAQPNPTTLPAAEKPNPVTALIPAFVGVPLVMFGLIAFKPSARMHAMHGAVLLALIGFLMAAGRLIVALVNNKGSGLARATLVGMALLTGIYVVLCVRSFIAARKARKLEAAA